VARRTVVRPHHEVHTTGSGGLGTPYSLGQEVSAETLSLEFGKDAERQQGGMALTGDMHRQRISTQRAVMIQQNGITAMDIEKIPEKQTVVTLALPERLLVEPVQPGKILFFGGPELILPTGWHTWGQGLILLARVPDRSS
jgi:hypothetical protein